MATIEEMIQDMKDHCTEHKGLVANKLSEVDKMYALHEVNLQNLITWQKNQNGSVDDLKACMLEVKKELHTLSLDIVRGRPTWATAIILGALSSAVVGLLVAMLR